MTITKNCAHCKEFQEYATTLEYERENLFRVNQELRERIKSRDHIILQMTADFKVALTKAESEFRSRVNEEHRSAHLLRKLKNRHEVLRRKYKKALSELPYEHPDEYIIDNTES